MASDLSNASCDDEASSTFARHASAGMNREELAVGWIDNPFCCKHKTAQADAWQSQPVMIAFSSQP
jgi:hypothetical protein